MSNFPSVKAKEFKDLRKASIRRVRYALLTHHCHYI